MIGAIPSARERRAPWIVFVAAATLAGAFLRSWQLGSQIFADDEWHAIQKMLTSDYGDIATHLGLADYCIPLTLFFKFLAAHDRLTEWAMRAPVLFCGIALIPLAPWLMRRQASPPTLALWSGLLAISPIMVYHSHVVRPYAITTLLVFFALMAIYRWWTEDGRRWTWALLYVVAATLSAWFHLITLPFVLMPFVYFGIASLLPLLYRTRKFDARRFAGLVIVGIITACSLAAFLLPPLVNDWSAIRDKSATGYVEFDTIHRMMLDLYGSGSLLVAIAVTVFFIVGAMSWWKREKFFVGYIGTVVCVTALAIGVSHPAWIQHSMTFGRYLQPAVPFLLLFIAEGFMASLIALHTNLRMIAAVAAVAALYMLGPLRGYLYDPNQFMVSPFFVFDVDPTQNPLRTFYPQATVLEFYHRLAAQPPRSLTLIDAPWSILSYGNRLLFYQRDDRQMQRIGLVGDVCGKKQYGEFDENSGVHFRHFVHISALMRGEHHGDFLILHRKAWMSPPEEWPDIDACLPTIEAKIGEPVYTEDDLVVFALSDKARDVAKSWSAPLR